MGELAEGGLSFDSAVLSSNFDAFFYLYTKLALFQ